MVGGMVGVASKNSLRHIRSNQLKHKLQRKNLCNRISLRKLARAEPLALQSGLIFTCFCKVFGSFVEGFPALFGSGNIGAADVPPSAVAVGH